MGTKLDLELEDSKSRLLEFGKFAESNRKTRGESKPETFDFQDLRFIVGEVAEGIHVSCYKQVERNLDKS